MGNAKWQYDPAEHDWSWDGYRPAYPDSPEMYARGETDEDKKAREWFEDRGYTFEPY